MNLQEFGQLVRSRRSVRNFKPDPIPDKILHELLDLAHWAPSGYNLQPTHFVMVDDEKIKPQLREACMGQRQVSEAPVVVVFTGDRKVVDHNLERILEMEREEGAITSEYEKIMKKYVGLAFDQGPVGFGWMWKSCCLPLVQRFRPIPSMPAVHKRYWLTKQVLLTAMVLMLAAHSEGLASVPMEGFDEKRVKSVLQIPASHIVPLVMPIGYPADTKIRKTRLPIENLVHKNRW